MNTKLRAYQLEGAKAIKAFGGRALLADEMGLGKSIQSLYYAYRCPKARPVLIICPAGVKYNWQHELKHHFGLPSAVLEGVKPPKKAQVTTNDFYIINYDILHAWVPYLQRLKIKLVIIDECQYAKNRSTRRYKAVRDVCKKVKKVVALSGTPFTNRPAELWPILNILKPDEFPRWMEYAMRYCQPYRSPWGWQFKGAAHLRELHHRLKQTCTIRRLKADVLKELPAKQRVVQYTKLTNASDYTEATTDFLGWLKKESPTKAKKASRALAIVKMTKLLHLCGIGKLLAVFDWVDNFLQSTDEKLVVFGIHRDVLGPLYDRYRNIAVKIDGSTTGRKRHAAKDMFQDDPKIRLAICNQKAGGVGLTMTAASTELFIELGFVPADHAQAEARVHRFGQTAKVTIYYMISKDTLEEPLVRLLHAKQGIIDQVMDNKAGNTSLDLIGPMINALNKL